MPASHSVAADVAGTVTGSAMGFYPAAAAILLALSGPAVTASSAQAATPRCGGRVATLAGTPGSDVLTGTPGDDVIAGLTGRDSIDGGAGDDMICGGSGQDVTTSSEPDERPRSCSSPQHRGR